jgi:iron(III) transport system substrate-binding protein
LISESELPKTIAGLPAHPRIREAGIANPVFGTSSTHAAALYSEWGDEVAKTFYRSLKDAGISVLEGNGSVKDYVGKGRLAFGLVDTYDAFEAMEKNPDLDMALLDQGDGKLGTLVIPNSVALMNGAPHKPEAEAFMEYILSVEAEQECVNMDWIHIPVHGDVTPPEKFGSSGVTVMRVNWTDLVKKLTVSANDMMNIFVN